MVRGIMGRQILQQIFGKKFANIYLFYGTQCRFIVVPLNGHY